MNQSVYGHIAQQHHAVGILKLATGTLNNEIGLFRERVRYYQPFAFGAVRDHNLKLYKQLLDIYFTVPYTSFSVFYHEKSYSLGQLIANSLNKQENMVVFVSSQYHNSAHRYSEEDTREMVKRKMRRDALFGIHPVSIRDSSELQMAQVLLGIVSHAVSLLDTDPITKNAKFRLVKHLQRHLNTDKLARTNEYYLRFKRRFAVEL
ncbi:MAG: hypothetical protein NUV52_00120 [Candidatus Roizmanbacteria bacterium]|nr:hypothetical protein [Candidatus Roizmanbacteria bacterium]